MLGEYVDALSILNAASSIMEEGASNLDKDETALLLAELAVARSKALFQKGAYRQAIDLCQHVLKELPADEIELRAEAHMRLGMSANLLGNFTAGIAQLQTSLQLWRHHTQGRQLADVHSALASAYSLLGNITLAEHHLARAIACWDQLHNTWGKVDNLIRMGLIKQRQGAFLDAEAILNEALELASGPLRFRRGQAYALVNLGELYQDQVDNCLEDAHYGLMRCHLRQGKRGLALRQYQRCKEILREELAISPGPAMQALYQRLGGSV